MTTSTSELHARTVNFVAGLAAAQSPTQLCERVADLAQVRAGTPALQHEADEALEHLMTLERVPDTAMVEALSAEELVEFSNSFDAAFTAADFEAAATITVETLAVCAQRILAGSSGVETVDDRGGKHRLRFQSRGRFAALYTRDDELVATFDRGTYFSTQTAMPATFVVTDEGSELAAVAVDWDKLAVYDPPTGELVAGPFGHGDPFIGRAKTDLSGRYLAFDAWVWHPLSMIGVVAVDDLLTGVVPVLAGSDVDYLFDRPFCWVQRPDMTPVVAALGSVSSYDDLAAANKAAGVGVVVDAMLAVEFIDVTGTTVAVVNVGDAPWVGVDEFERWSITAVSGAAVVACDGVEVATVPAPTV